MQRTKIYTKLGDKGQTHLATGQKVSKATTRIDAYGTIDELNAVMGMLRDVVGEKKFFHEKKLEQEFSAIQNSLFDLGAELASLEPSLTSSGVCQSDIAALENSMDDMNKHLEPLKNFVLPGGFLANSVAHFARTVCRRAERCVVKLAAEQSVRPEVIRYINRLSDWLFIVCRFVMQKEGRREVLWSQRTL